MVVLFECAADSRAKLPVVDVAGHATSARAAAVPITSSELMLVAMVVNVTVAEVLPTVGAAAALRIMQVAPGHAPERLVSTPR